MRTHYLLRNLLRCTLGGIAISGIYLTLMGVPPTIAAEPAQAEPTLAVSDAANPGVPWSATDSLQRSTTSPGRVLPGKTVGIFYFLWHEASPQAKAPWNDGPYDIMKIHARDPDASKKPDSPFWGKATGAMHYWGEPMYGYYQTTDPWVLRRHAMLLTDAGIDMVIFDTTNAVIYTPQYRALCDVWSAMRREGERTPQIAFMVNTAAGKTGRLIYDDLYKNGDYKDLWFIWDQKPLLICDPADADEELTNFFTLRRAHWPFKMVNTDRAWHWEAAYPQPYGYVDDVENVEQVNVSVAQNLRTAPDAQVTNMSDGNARGRSFCNGQLTPEIATDEGRNFSEQWNRAYELDPPFVMVTGWNEWIAGNWGVADQSLKFVDQFDREYSRDIEPMKDGHGDNYYLQLVAGVRRYKGAPALPNASQRKTIEIAGDFTQWDDVQPEFRDHVGETTPRNWDGVAGTHYQNDTGRNDLVRCKFTRDAENMYFYLETAQDFRFDGAVPDHLILLLDQKRVTTKGKPKYPASGDWCDAEYRVVATGDSQRTWELQKRDGRTWRATQLTVTYRLEGNQLQLAIPLTGRNPRFKWLDHCCEETWTPEALYQDGDVAPESRFFYEVR